jgi:hypothetical protein
MPIIALKVLNKDGSGTLSAFYTAFAHVLALLKSGTRIVAVNMSLTMNDGLSAPDPADQEVTCGYIHDISAYGTALVVAAGASSVASLSVLCSACSTQLLAKWM